MPEKPDDLEAVRTIVKTLEHFDKDEQERILRWAREKMGLHSQIIIPNETPASIQYNPNLSKPQHYQQKDLKSFVNEKNPASDMQFAVTVAYYYKFEAPENDKKEAINSEILQDAARLAQRVRLKNPGQTLINASFNGMLDKSEGKGSYKINTVGENLVAMTLPQNSISKNKKYLLKLK